MLRLVLRLEREASDLRLQLAHDVGHPREVVEGLHEPSRRLVALHLEALDPGGLLEQLAPLLRPQGERRVDGSLSDDDELVGAEPPLAQQVDHVPQPRAGAVDEVLAVARPIRPAADAHLGEVDRQPAVAVLEGQDRLGHALRLAVLGAREDDVVGAAGAQRSVRLLAEDPADRIGHVALPRAVRADDRVDARVEDEAGRVGERLEAVEAELLEAAHVAACRALRSSTRVASAPAAARSSARWRLEPAPCPRRRPSSWTATSKCCSCGGPLVATTW